MKGRPAQATRLTAEEDTDGDCDEYDLYKEGLASKVLKPFISFRCIPARRFSVSTLP